MGEITEISWCDHTANFWWGCVHVSALCDHCYADKQDTRYAGKENSHFGPHARRRFIKSVWSDLPKWNAKAQAKGEKARVFVMSMGDFFERLALDHPDRNLMDETRLRAMRVMEELTWLEFLVLTKRIGNVAGMVLPHWLDRWPANIRGGISVGTQKDADRDIVRLLELPCPNFLSMEPLLENVEIGDYLASEWISPLGKPHPVRSIQWVITGGESGPEARPSHPDWFRSLRDECVSAGVPFHFKQWGELCPFERIQGGPLDGYWRGQQGSGFHSETYTVEERLFQGAPSGEYKRRAVLTVSDDLKFVKLGKAWAGRLLDGRTWNEFPTSSLEVPA